MSIPSTDSSTVDSIWDPFKDIIYTLYIERNLSLTKVRNEMGTKYQFIASKAQYELRFSKWGFRKNQTAEDWKAVARKIIIRKQKHKDSDVYINGALIDPKKVRKETVRYGSRPIKNGLLVQPSSPRIPEGFIIRTPSPNGAKPILALATPLSTGPHLSNSPPFLHFNSIFSPKGTLFPGMLGSNSGASAFLPQSALFHIITQSKEEKDWQDCIGDHIRNARALMPENFFIGNPGTMETELLQGQESSALDFLGIIIYLISNNFSLATEVIIQHIYKRAKGPLFTTFLKRLCSVGGDITEKLAPNLFPLAIDADDFEMVKRMIEWGINPNIAYNCYWHGVSTPLEHACFMQSVEMVQVLINGGASLNTDMRTWGNDILSLVIYPELFSIRSSSNESPYDSTDDGCYHKEQIKIKLIQFLLGAGAPVNPNHCRSSPLATAARFGYAKIVTLLLAAGSDVNSSGPESRSTPLIDAVIHSEGIPERDLITVVRSLLQAGTDIQGLLHDYHKPVTVLEAAIPRRSALLVQLLLNSGAKITEFAFAKAAEFCDLDTVELLIKPGARVTQEIIRCAAKNEEPEPLWFLLDSAQDDIKHQWKCAALYQCISDGNLDFIDKLAASGAELCEPEFQFLEPGFDLAGGIEAIVERCDMHVLRWLLGRYHKSLRLSLVGALTAAILRDQDEAVEMLLMASADLNGEKWSRIDPLLAAASRRNSQLIRRLLAAGAAVNKIKIIEEFGHNYEAVTTILPAVVS